jgi:hypothetical protein
MTQRRAKVECRIAPCSVSLYIRRWSVVSFEPAKDISVPAGNRIPVVQPAVIGFNSTELSRFNRIDFSWLTYSKYLTQCWHLTWSMYERQSKSSRNSLTSTVRRTMSSYRMDRVLLALSTCKFCRGSGATRGRQAGRDSGFCFTIMHRATHRLLCYHPTAVLSGSRSEWLLVVPMEDFTSNAMVELRKIPKEGFCRCFQQWQDGWTKYVCVCSCKGTFWLPILYIPHLSDSCYDSQKGESKFGRNLR